MLRSNNKFNRNRITYSPVCMYSMYFPAYSIMYYNVFPCNMQYCISGCNSY